MSLLGTINPNLNPSRSVGAVGSHDADNNEVGAAARETTHHQHDSEEVYEMQDPGEGSSKDEKMKGRDRSSSLSSAETALEKADGSEDEIREEEIHRLAQRLTRNSTRFSSTGLENPFIESKEDSTLNPHSPNFKSKHWMKNLLALSSRDPAHRKREAGVAFRNLSVHGYGSPTDYQKDVFNAVLQIGALARTIAGSGKQKIQILRDFDGLVKSGEMLVVLGRPGRYDFFYTHFITLTLCSMLMVPVVVPLS